MHQKKRAEVEDTRLIVAAETLHFLTAQSTEASDHASRRPSFQPDFLLSECRTFAGKLRQHVAAARRLGIGRIQETAKI